MSESENVHHVRVNDRRRFNPDGSPREDDVEETHTEAKAGEQEQPAVEAANAAEVNELREKLDAAHRRIDELARALQAGERDREEFKKRVQRERERLLEVEKGNVAQVLLDAVDELDLSLASADPTDALAQGVRMIRDGMISRLGSMGIERVQLLGRPYDPNLAEAMDMEITSDPNQDQLVVTEMRPAYKMGERVIREGKVKVARYFAPALA